MAIPELDETFRREWPRIVAAVVRFTGSLELAEDAVQEAFARAATARERELLINPAAWITTVAKHIAIDAARRDKRLRQRLPLLAVDEASAPPARSGHGDDRLDLLFVTCTPRLAPETRLALALRFVCAIPTDTIADAMLVSHTAMSARLTRAKRQIEADGIRFALEEPAELDERLPDVLQTVHLLYTLGHTAAEGDDLESPTITATALELARGLRSLRPDDRETAGLLALLLLSDARGATRVDGDGELVTLEEADRSRWNHAEITEGVGLAAFALPGGGRLALEAGVSGLHCEAASWALTDWSSIGMLYDRLVESWPSPSAQVARLVARSFVDPGAALHELDELEPRLRGVAARNAVAARADILRRLGRRAEARAAYVRARSFERNGPVGNFFGRRIAELDA